MAQKGPITTMYVYVRMVLHRYDKYSVHVTGPAADLEKRPNGPTVNVPDLRTHPRRNKWNLECLESEWLMLQNEACR